jgi:5-formyltetrahydrofolate cyclo-ligase
MEDVLLEKKALRAEMFLRRNSLSQEIHKTLSERLSGALIAEIFSQNPKVIHTFLPMGAEPDFRAVIQKCLSDGRTVICPETLPKPNLQHRELKSLEAVLPGRFGTVYPNSDTCYTGTFDLILVPLLAFDALGYRLGYGGGYYDTFLADCTYKIALGVAFPFQCIAKVPTEPHDIKLDGVITG